MREVRRGAPNLAEARKTCEKWDEIEGCKDDYPEECFVSVMCEMDACADLDVEGSCGT